MKYGKMAALAVVLMGILITCTGCKSESPLGSRMFVEAAGVDRSPEGTTAVTLWSYLADEGENNGQCMSGTGASVTGALAALTAQTGREPYFPHNGALVIGEQTAAQGIENLLRFFTEYTGCRVGVPLFVAEGSAEEVIRGAEGNSLYRLTDEAVMAGETVRTPLYTTRTADGVGDFAAPVLRAGDTGVEVTGTALFTAGRMTGTLTKPETVGMHLLGGTLTNALVHCALPGGGTATVAVTMDDTACRGSGSTREITVQCHGWLFESDFEVDDQNAGPIREQLQSACVKQLTEGAEKAWRQIRLANANVFGWTNFSEIASVTVKMDMEIRLKPENS